MMHASFVSPSMLAGLMLGATLALAPLAQASPHHASSDSRQDRPQATLSAQASAQVQQDTVQVTLAAEISGASQAIVSDQLNARLDAVMKQAKGHDGIDVRSGSYRLWPMNDQDGRISEWRGHAEILLQSRDFKAASQLAAQLSDRMPIAGLAFSVSRERQAAEEQKLMQQAVKAFQDRAQALAQALGFSAYRLHAVDLGGTGEMPAAPMPRMMMSAMAADKVAAPIEGGSQVISVSVQGTIVLLPAGTATDQ
ncbi:SIMPL domain-containing protein [Castellaniella sp.]|uniref:SIMPL domain-containing protein n=1 Tax=Castellaniella sp. TaxID=1955812 RepID=UPI002AFF8881|nr:SIMPL domain-containing protein [Castellaniella sp.]